MLCGPARRQAIVGRPSRYPQPIRGIKADPAALADIEKRIQIVEDNLRELVEQAAAYSGAADEERNADRIADHRRSSTRF